MRNFLIVLAFLVILVNAAQAADNSFVLDTPPNVSYKAENLIKKGYSSELAKNSSTTYETPKKENPIVSFFKKLFKREDKIKAQFDSDTRGYTGTLPNLNSEFQYKRPKTTSGNDQRQSAEEFFPEEFKQSELEDPLFLDVILNKEKPSPYVGDMLRVMKFLETFRQVIVSHQPVQKFNANVNVLDLHTKRIEKLYANKPEGMSPSYWLLLDLTYKAKVLGNLKFDANYYSKFSPVTGTKYDPVNLIEEDNKLLQDLDKTVFAIIQLNN